MTRLEHDWFPGSLPDNVTIGAGSWLYSSYAFRHYRSSQGVRIGRDSGIYDGSYFDLGPDGEALIGDYCTIVGAILSGNLRVEMHDFTFVAHEVVITDDPFACPLDQPGRQARALHRDVPTIVLGENCWIGARAILLPGAHIGRDAIVGAGAVVDFVVPDGALAAGNPGRVITTSPSRGAP